ncbi:hypothetical protein PACTADRAFT_590 [Pachysolen tannophilus NRRL Y-2460]|uniref:Phenylacetate 2-hydroxylase n=1 Tax=Pachysolen tannophilus NRRL Y-2460 TaxID=669874 RepID=A0A1E4U267_PACTA|nr:hypothetical protein PACTADRAFT_590 [Pachysolen tannophilus NRRL Y-2460]
MDSIFSNSHNESLHNSIISFLNTSSPLTNALLILLSVAILYLGADISGLTCTEVIKNIPSIPSYPIVGNAFQVIYNPSIRYFEWAKEYGDVFQIRLGIKRVIVANSYDSIKDLWIRNCNSNNSRPVLHTFHKVLSKSAIYTIGTTPFGESYKKKKKYVSTHLNKRSVDSFSKLIGDETTCAVFRVLLNSKNEQIYGRKGVDMDMLKFVQYFSLRISLKLTYDYTIDVDYSERNLADEIIYVENWITRMRSHTSNLQDFIPLLRWLSFDKNSKAEELRRRRDEYMDKFFEYAQSSKSKNCLVNEVLLDPERNISINELKSICLTMVSAGLDNTGLNLDYCLGHLSNAEKGYRIQSIAYQEILNSYGSAFNAWKNCTEEFSCEYIVALIRETLRHMTVLPLSLPRETTKDIHYHNAIIPKGTILFMNAYAGNHDPKYFPEPNNFMPERYLNSNLKLLDGYNNQNGRNCVNCNNNTGGTIIPSFSFGVGSRMCSGNHLAFKEMYVFLIRFLLMFQVNAPLDENLTMELDPIKLNEKPDSIAIEPKLYKVNLSIRDLEFMENIKKHEEKLLIKNSLVFKK